MTTEGNEVREHIKQLRRTAGMSQEQLAEASGLSVFTIQKAEQGKPVRTETLHTIARALDVPTSRLFVGGTPAPVVGDMDTSRRLVPLRMALMPPIGVTGVEPPAEAPEIGGLGALRRQIMDVHTLYRAGRYDSVVAQLPALLVRAGAAVRTAEGDDRVEAEAVRVLALLVAGKFTTQLRQYDLAYHALADAIRTARDAGDQHTAAVGVVGLLWLLLRQNRFDECYRLAIDTAELVEPRMTETDPARISLYGELWLRAAAAAVRDGRYDDAEVARGMAARAAGGMRRQDEMFPSHWGGFGPATAAIKAAEDCLVMGQDASDARELLRRAGTDALSPEALKSRGKPTAIDWSRHKLDVASAHVILGSHQAAMEELVRIKEKRGTWMRHQPMARRVVGDVLKTRKRTLTQDMRDMATYLGVAG
ncbi:helix-turn-helix domain-containing protein [Streptomyces sp. NPDC091292]|uniref:helix-turn-helix domain-containing protein n=1 Tax=Streptomyces sp. NPDC091292 TaxID=3365991 RepID=UPI00380B40B0